MRSFDPRSFTAHELAARLKISMAAAWGMLDEMCKVELAERIETFSGRRTSYRLTPLRVATRRYRQTAPDEDMK